MDDEFKPDKAKTNYLIMLHEQNARLRLHRLGSHSPPQRCYQVQRRRHWSAPLGGHRLGARTGRRLSYFVRASACEAQR